MNENPYIDRYIDNLILTEGGFTKNPEDAGHQLRVVKGDKWDSYCTNFGITQFTLSEYHGEQASVRAVTRLTKDEAKAIYLKMYFLAYRIDEVAKDFQLLMLDMVVQHKYAIRIIQKSINDADYTVTVDNLIGLKTVEAINYLTQKMGGYFVNIVNYNRIEYYESLGKNNEWAIKGWLNRAEKFIVFPNSGAAIVRNKIHNVRKSYGLV